ncbi:unnamed protein product, partial [Laminaria digitata]
AGVAVNADIGRVKHDYGVDGTGGVDVGVLAGKHVGVAAGNRSLAALAVHFLRRQLAKGSVRVGDWEKAPLSDEQADYAGLDSYVSVLVYRYIIERA